MTRVPAPLRDAAVYGAGLAWTKGLALVMVPILTRALSPAQFGTLEVLSSMAEVGALIAGAGLIDTLYRFASGGVDDKAAAARVCGLALCIAMTAALAVCAASAAIAHLLPGGVSRTQVLLLGLCISLEPLIGVPMAWLRMRGQAGRYAAVQAGRASIQTALVGALVAAGWGVQGVLTAGLAAACLTAAGLAAAQSRSTGIAIAPGTWGEMLRYGVPLVGAGLAAFILGTADRMLLSGNVSAAALGQYGLAAKFSMMAALLTQPFELWWFPRRLAVLGQPGGAARTAQVVGAGAAFVMLAATGAAIAGPVLIQTLTPPAYHPGSAYVPFLAAALALQSLGSLVSVGCYVGRTGSRSFAVNAAAAAVALAGYLLLIPHWGVAGAVAATVAAQIARTTLFHVISQRHVRIAYPFQALGLLAMPCVAAAAAPQFLPSGLTAIVGALLAFFIAMVMAALTGLVPLPAGIIPSFRVRDARA